MVSRGLLFGLGERAAIAARGQVRQVQRARAENLNHGIQSLGQTCIASALRHRTSQCVLQTKQERRACCRPRHRLPRKHRLATRAKAKRARHIGGRLVGARELGQGSARSGQVSRRNPQQSLANRIGHSPSFGWKARQALDQPLRRRLSHDRRRQIMAKHAAVDEHKQQLVHVACLAAGRGLDRPAYRNPGRPLLRALDHGGQHSIHVAGAHLDAVAAQTQPHSLRTRSHQRRRDS